jgi:fructokinase
MIVCCGEALVDMVPTRTAAGEAAFLPCPGGSPYNSAIALGRLGRDTGFLGNLSTDFFGELLVSRLAKNGVSTGRVKRVPKPSTLAFVNIEPGKDPEYAFYMEGTADRSLSASELPDEPDTEPACILAGSISLVLEPCGTSIVNFLLRESSRRIVSFDPNIRATMIHDRGTYLRRFRELVSRASIVKISEVDLAWLYPGVDIDEAFDGLFRTAMDGRLEADPLLVVLTRGGSGAQGRFCHGGRTETASVPGLIVQVVDTIGAGDTFHAGLLGWLDENGFLSRPALPSLDSGSLAEALGYANACASLACGRRGAEPPFADEVRELLARRNQA